MSRSVARGCWALSLLLALGAGRAEAVAPDVPWFTIETPNFRVHFHDGPHMYELAQRVARTCEAAHALLVPRLQWRPWRKTDVMLKDDVDSANGSAFSMYRPWMSLLVEVPEDTSVLNDFDDYLWNLIVHEYTHVLHLDTATGIPEAVNTVFGKLLIPNGWTPRWLIEGLATFEESNLSNSGRLRSSLFEMWLRTSLLQHPYDLAEVTHVPFGWPRGNLAYLYGGQFMSYVAQRVGEERLPEYFRLYGGRILPFTLNESAQEVWSVDFVQLYGDWVKSAQERYTEQLRPVREAGPTKFQALTRAGYGTEQPHFTHDGTRILYMEAGPDRRPQLRAMAKDGSGDRLIRELWGSGSFDVSPDDRRVVMSLGEIVDEYYVFDDLYELELATGHLERLSEGLRASEPAYSPDGGRIAFVAREGGAYSYLGVMDRATHEVHKVVGAGPDERLYTPVFTPDGRALVVSQKSGTGRKLVRVDLATRTQEVLLDSDAMIGQPTFARDGTLWFSSDRSGIYNLYAFDPESGALRQMTNVETGAFHPSPSPSGDDVAFVTYSWNGYDVAVMHRDDAFVGFTQSRPPRPSAPYRDDPRDALPVRPYQPLETLAPVWWLPVFGSDALGASLGVTTSGGDILNRHLWSADVSWGLTSKEPGFYLGYSNRTFHPGVDAYVTSFIAQEAGFGYGQYDRQTAVGAQTSFPSSSMDSYSAISLGYEYRYYDPRFTVQLSPDSPRPRLPRRGATGVATVGFYFSNARGFGNSVSAEEGHAVSLSVRHSSRYTLGDFEFTSVDARYQTYLRAPWAQHHAFALQLSAASAVGDVGDRPVYALGGISLYDPVLQLVRGQRVGSGALRGYAPGAFSGNTYALGTLEYRFPVWVVDEGVDTVPFFFRRLHAAVFADAGAVGRQAFELGAVHPAAGVEARADFVVAYELYSMLRLGLARGLGEGGLWNAYLTVGSTF